LKNKQRVSELNKTITKQSKEFGVVENVLVTAVAMAGLK
jgi:hypothetical protein